MEPCFVALLYLRNSSPCDNECIFVEGQSLSCLRPKKKNFGEILCVVPIIRKPAALYGVEWVLLEVLATFRPRQEPRHQLTTRPVRCRSFLIVCENIQISYPCRNSNYDFSVHPQRCHYTYSATADHKRLCKDT
jgi:hypothetical protein